MKKNQTNPLSTCVALVALFAASISSQTIPAFPGAEGFGKWAQGGRGGEVIYVTTTEDNNNPGSLRHALTQSGPRTVVIRKGGTITLSSAIEITNPCLTIAGQTAPGGGIAIKVDGQGNFAPIIINTHDVIIRHIRVCPGPVSGDGDNGDAIIISGGYDIIVDHCSLSWAVDEIVSSWGTVQDITIQHCIISEGLNAGHVKGPHSSGAILGWYTDRASMYRNLFAHNWMRNPYLNTNYAPEHIATYQLVNNLVYNWEIHGTQIGHNDYGLTQANVIGNYYKPGLDYDNSLYNDVMALGDETKVQVYVKNNIGPRRPDDAMDEWEIVGGWSTQASTEKQSLTPFNAPELPVLSAYEAYDSVLTDAGATKPARDTVDKRIIRDVKEGTGTIIHDPSEVGGWPTLAQGTPPEDTDRDGMPDAWEDGKGLNPTTADHNGFDLHSQYTNLEIYLQYLAGDIASEPDPPTVAFTQPTETVVTEPADLGVVAKATAPNGSIDNVKLYLDDTFVRQENNAPYEWGTAGATTSDSVLLGLTEGAYTLRLTATDAQGATASDTMEITVEPAAVGVSGDALQLSPVSADHAPRVFDMRGRRVVRASVPGAHHGNARTVGSPTRGVFIVRSRRNPVASAQIVVPNEGN